MVMQLNIPKLGTAMYRIPSGFMNCIHKTRCGQCNGCHLPFINGSLKWLRSHWRFMLWASILSKPYTLLNAARVWHYLLSSHLFNSAFFPAATLWMPDIQLRNVWYSDSKKNKTFRSSILSCIRQVFTHKLDPGIPTKLTAEESWRVHPLKLCALASCLKPTKPSQFINVVAIPQLWVWQSLVFSGKV